MLDFLRRGVKTWVAKVLFALLVASFAIWGIGDVFSHGLGSTVATVGKQDISAERYATAVQREMRAQSQRFGQPIDAETARALGLDRQILALMAQEATLDQQMEELAVSIPNDVVARIIAADPNFAGATDGFDAERYRNLISQAGYSVEAYEDMTRRSIARSELARALSDGGMAPPGAAEIIYEYQVEERSFDYLRLTAAAHGVDPGPADDATLDAWRTDNADLFTTPERRSATFIHLDIDTLGKDHTPDEAELRALYDARALSYDRPERRTLYQTMFDTRAEAEEAYALLTAGETLFDGVLGAKGETRADTALGDVTRADLAPAVAEAAFGTNAPGVVEPVDTGFGFALIDVASITPATVTTFEDVRASLIADLQHEAALNRAPEIAGEIEDQRASGAALAEAAEALGLTLQKVNGVSRDGDGADGFAASPDFLNELFAAELEEERDILPTDNGSYFVLHLDAVEEAELSPLEDVRGAVEAGWRQEQVLISLDLKADDIVKRLSEGTDFSTIADELGLTLASEGPHTRTGDWNALPLDLVSDLFAETVGATGHARDEDGVVIARVATAKEGAETEENAALLASLETRMNAMAGDDALTLFLSAKQDEAGVTVNQQVIDSILSQVR